MSEIQKLLQELQNMKSEARNSVINSKETWNKIGQKDLTAAGFESEEKFKEWLASNPYSNI